MIALILILILLWALGFGFSFGGNLIHALLLVVLLLAIYHLATGRRRV